MTYLHGFAHRQNAQFFKHEEAKARRRIQLTGIILAFASLLFTQQQANAASLTWNYVQDSLNDGHDRLNGVSNPGIVGSSSAYELARIS